MLNLSDTQITQFLYSVLGVGAVFVGFFLAAYLGGLPSTAVLHSEPVFRIPLAIVGAVLLVLVFSALIVVAVVKRN
jgi:hypothetical protein